MAPSPLRSGWVQARIQATFCLKVVDAFRFVNGDLILDNEADVDFSLVVRGNLYIRKGALIAGNLKAHGDLVVENSAVIGSLTCKGRLSLIHI